MTDMAASSHVPFAINEPVPESMGRSWVTPMKVASIGVAITTGLSAIQSVLAIGLIGTYASFEAGEISLAETIDAETPYNVLTLVYLVVFAITAIVTMVGLHGLASALRDKPGTHLDYQPKWTVLGWIIPFLNLVRPAQVMKDLDRATSGSINQKQPTVALWWALSISVAVASRVAAVTTDLSTYAWASLWGDLLTVPTGIAFVLILRRLSTNASNL